MQNSTAPKGFLKWYAIMVYCFILFPLFVIFLASFSEASYLTFPPKGWSLKWYENIYNIQAFIDTLIVSLQVATISTLGALIVGIPVAYAMSRFHVPGKSALNFLFVTPVVIPGAVAGFSLLNMLAIQLKMPIISALLIGHILVLIPYAVRVVSAGLANLDPSIDEAAMTLGASRFKTFFVIILPNISSAIIAAFLLAFISSLNNVPISAFLTGPGISTLPIQMLSYVEYYFDPTVAALSVFLILLTAIVMVIVERTLGLNYFAK